MNPLKGFSVRRVLLLLLVSFLLCGNGGVLSSSLSKSHAEHHNGCDAIQRILNGTGGGGENHHNMQHHNDKDEGFLADHEQWHNHKDLGSICRGRCCNHRAETELSHKATHNFRQTMRHHTKSLRSKMVTTAKLFREHIMQLSLQSEAKTLHIFAQIYGRLAPLARSSVTELYDNIRSRLRRVVGEETLDIEKQIHNFFVDFYPVVYHHVLLAGETSDYAGSDSMKDFRADYKKCIKHTYEDVLPFGHVPQNLARSLHQSIGAAAVFLRALEQGATVLESVEQLDESLFGAKCASHLVKMNYCQECDGSRKVKSCHGYCLNVMRGCLTQFVGSMDRPWASFALAVEQLQHMVRSKEGIESVLRSLDGHLSEAIIQAMQNGPHLQTKVKQLCGSPAFVAVSSGDVAAAAVPAGALGAGQQGLLTDEIIPLDTEMIQFLVTIENSQEFYSNIVNSYCEDNEFQQDDKSCWTGDRIGEYTNTVMPTGISSQKYNPEVPYSADEFRAKFEVNELGDKLINLKQSISIAMTKYSDRLDLDDNMQSDMAEGSAGWADGDTSDDFPEASGSGSGPVIAPTKAPDQPTYGLPEVKQGGSEVGSGGKADHSFAISVHNWSWASWLLSLSAFLALNRQR